MNYFAVKAITLIGGDQMVAQVQTLIKALQEAHDLGVDQGRAAVIDEIVGDDQPGKVNAHVEGDTFDGMIARNDANNPAG